MAYYTVPKVDGELDIDYRDLLAGCDQGGDIAYVSLRAGAKVRESWTEITEAEFMAVAAVPDIVAPDPLADLKAKVDLLLTAKIKSGELTTDMVAASALAETTKAELTAAITKAVEAAK